jgi:uroporphyrinogen decarboxylase
VTAFCEAHLRRQLEACRGRIDLVFTADDLGGQRGMLMSLATWQCRIRPWHERLNAVAHEHGARVIYHTDGSVMPVVPGLVDAGIDILQALQFDAGGMDAHVLKERFGSRIGFQGGISVQRTLPFGTEDQALAVRVCQAFDAAPEISWDAPADEAIAWLTAWCEANNVGVTPPR